MDISKKILAFILLGVIIAGSIAPVVSAARASLVVSPPEKFKPQKPSDCSALSSSNEKAACWNEYLFSARKKFNPKPWWCPFSRLEVCRSKGEEKIVEINEIKKELEIAEGDASEEQVKKDYEEKKISLQEAEKRINEIKANRIKQREAREEARKKTYDLCTSNIRSAECQCALDSSSLECKVCIQIPENARARNPLCGERKSVKDQIKEGVKRIREKFGLELKLDAEECKADPQACENSAERDRRIEQVKKVHSTDETGNQICHFAASCISDICKVPSERVESCLSSTQRGILVTDEVATYFEDVRITGGSQNEISCKQALKACPIQPKPRSDVPEVGEGKCVEIIEGETPICRRYDGSTGECLEKSPATAAEALRCPGYEAQVEGDHVLTYAVGEFTEKTELKCPESPKKVYTCTGSSDVRGGITTSDSKPCTLNFEFIIDYNDNSVEVVDCGDYVCNKITHSCRGTGSIGSSGPKGTITGTIDDPLGTRSYTAEWDLSGFESLRPSV